MKLISKDAAIAAIRFIPDEVKPLSGYYVPTLTRAIAVRYNLAKVPPLDEAVREGAKFQTGHFLIDSREIQITELGIFGNTLAATTYDTADSELIVNDLFVWLKEKHGFRDPATKPVRVFQSDLIVEFDNDPEHAMRLFAPLVEFLQAEGSSLNSSYEKAKVQFSRLGFGSDPLSPGIPSEFVVERRAETPWNLKRYFSKANLPTNMHIKALELLDELLAR